MNLGVIRLGFIYSMMVLWYNSVSDVVGYDRRRPRLSYAPADMEYETTV